MTPALVERDLALQQLAGCLQAVGADGGRIALVAGEAGIGKTSVLRAFARAQPLARLWWGACDALQTPHPLAPLHDIARECRPRFALQLGGPRAALFDAVLDELRHAGGEPVLLVVEDAHWADDATLDWIKFLGRRIAQARALLAISYRDDEVGASHPLRRVLGELPGGAVTRIELPRLTPAGVETLALRAARPAAGVHAATRGNPFFVAELLRDKPGSVVPASVQDLVLARYARLDAPAQALVRLVSVLPGRSERWLIDRLLAPALVDIDAAIASGLLAADETAIAFRHELGRVAVEAALSAPAAQALHAQVLQALAERDAAPARLVHHALRARDAAALGTYAPRAAREAVERGAHREAAAQWGIALTHGVPRDDDERREWLEQFAVECALQAQFDNAMQARRSLEADARARGDIAQAAIQLSRQALLYIGGMRHDLADQANLQARQLLEPLEPGRAHALVWQQESYLRMLNRDCEDSVVWGERAHVLAQAIGDREIATAARSAVATALLFIDYGRGVTLLQQALAEHLAAARLQAATVTLGNLGSGSGEVMQLVNAERWLHESLALASANEFDNQAYYCRAWLALTALLRGRWDEAAGWAAQVIGKPGIADMSRLMALLALARLRMRRGDPGAEAALDEGLALTGEHNTLQRIAPLRAARAQAALARGDGAAAAAEVAAALPLAVAHRHAWLIGDLAYAGWCAGTIAEPPPGCAAPYALEIGGDWRAAADAWQALDCPFERARALAHGDTEAQREALGVFDQLGARPAAEALRRRLHDAGVRGLARGPRASTRGHAFGLTNRELQVLQLLCAGLRNADIAARLHRSVRTVDHHLAAVFAKLGVDSRLTAIRAAQRAGLDGAQSGQAAPPN